VSAKQCQNFRERQVAATGNARLNSPFEFMSLTRQHADVGEILRFTSAVASQVAGPERFGVYRVAHSGDLFALADFQRPQPQLVVPARQHRIEGSPFRQISELQDSQEKFLHT
jgi:hypothetical protein